jgi:predicted dehydrogenase
MNGESHRSREGRGCARRAAAVLGSVCLLLLVSCSAGQAHTATFTGAAGEVRLMTLDPGHFHAALVQKTSYSSVSPVVHVYAPEGPDVHDHLQRIEGFNRRSEKPTHWRQRTYIGDDFLQRMLDERPGNVVVISGNNRKKAEYIEVCVEAGLHVLADKPMCIDPAGRRVIEQAFDIADRKGMLLYDIMTERSEITTILQRALVQNRQVFGMLVKGDIDDPAVVKQSIHHFFKYIAGDPIKRPAWYFDTTQQGEGIVDVTTHLVDLVMWECFPEQNIDYDSDVRMLRARRWPTFVSRDQFAKVTRLPDFPDYLNMRLDSDGVLPCYANGEMDYTICGVHARVSVAWEFQAPPGAGDTHYSIIRGTLANIIIRQGEAEQYCPELYVEPADGTSADALGTTLEDAMAALQQSYPGLALDRQENRWHVQIPDAYRIGHEAHFQQVMERYLDYLAKGTLPDWEVPNMKAKYRTTTEALDQSRH